MTSTHYLEALALLKVSSDAYGATFLDYITPFVADAIRADGRSELSNTEIRTILKSAYGMDVPEGVINTVTRRLAKKTLGIRSNHKFKPNHAALTAEYNLSSRRDECNKAIGDLASALSQFSSGHGIQLTTEQARSALVRYAEQHGLPILRRALTNGQLLTSLSLDAIEYITSLFVIEAFASQPQWRDPLVMLAKGSKLASVLYLADPEDVTKRVTNVTALLDTPTLLSALGYQGQEHELAARDVLDLAYASGVNLAVYDHTVAEMHAILDAVGSNVGLAHDRRRPPWGVEAHFLALGYNASDIKLCAGRLERDLSSLRVSIMERPAHSIELGIDESQLEARLQSAVMYPRREPLLHDIDALSSTFRLRKGRRPRRFEDCRFIFVTSNGPLARVSKQFFNDEYGDHWPITVEEDDFATLLWLKNPVAVPDLPAHRIVADAYAVLEPGLVVWESFIAELDRLKQDERITADDYYFFRYSSDSKEAVLAETRLNNVVEVSAETVAAILERVRAKLEEPLRRKVESEQAARLASEQAVATSQEESARIEDKAAETAAAHALEVEVLRRALDEERARADRLLAEQRTSARDKATRRAKVICNTARCLVGLLVVAGLAAATPDTWPLSFGDFAGKRLVGIVTAAAVLVAVFSEMFFGKPLWHVIREMEVRLATWIERRGASSTGGCTVRSMMTGSCTYAHRWRAQHAVCAPVAV